MRRGGGRLDVGAGKLKRGKGRRCETGEGRGQEGWGGHGVEMGDGLEGGDGHGMGETRSLVFPGSVEREQGEDFLWPGISFSLRNATQWSGETDVFDPFAGHGRPTPSPPVPLADGRRARVRKRLRGKGRGRRKEKRGVRPMGAAGVEEIDPAAHDTRGDVRGKDDARSASETWC